VHTVACRKAPDGSEVLFVGGSNKSLTAYKVGGDGGLSKLWATEVDSQPRSIDLMGTNLLVAFKNGNIFECQFGNEGISKPRTVMTSHCDGEVWGMDICHLDDGTIRLLSTGDDNRILAYDPSSKTVLCEGQVNAPLKADKKAAKPKRGGASSMSS